MSTTMVETVWRLPEIDQEAFFSFCEQHQLSGVLAELMYAKQFPGTKELISYLSPAAVPLSDPFLLTDMDKAVERIGRAKEKQEHIRVIGDYDVDGISATALLVRGLRYFGVEEVSFALPNRLEDGYGLNTHILSQAKSDGVTLVITVDNGITSVDEAAFASANGMDLIITDHHTLGDTLPEACAVINPKREVESSPFYSICGTTVAFELCTALNKRHDNLSLVALATIADVMPLTGENRLLTERGIEELRRGIQPGLQALMAQSKLTTRDVKAEDMAFQVGPRINASGRLGSGGSALQLLLTDDPEEAKYLAQELNTINEQRKDVERVISEEAHEMLTEHDLEDKRTIVLSSRQWHPGVIGIVASKLQHRYHKPVMIIGVNEDGLGRGSGRSNDGFSLIEALQSCSELFVKYGGHRNAAGITIEEDQIPALWEAMEEAAIAQEASKMPVRELTVDAVLAFSSIDNALLSEVDRLEPIGHGNPPPVFATFSAKLVQGATRILNGGHLQCSLEHDRRTFRAIGFNMAERLDLDNLPNKVDVAYIPKYNHWQGNTTIQLHLIDIKDSKRNSFMEDSA